MPARQGHHSSQPVTTLSIKNMVCPRCITAVRGVLSALGLQVVSVTLGEARVRLPGKSVPPASIDEELRKQGFELLVGEDVRLVERIKVSLLEYLRVLEEGEAPLKMSAFLSDVTGVPYRQLSRVFSKHEGVTLEQYYIRLKIERVKELLSYGQWTLGEIADRLQYSSVQHLSAQFRRIVGHSVRDYRQQGHPHRHPLDAIV